VIADDSSGAVYEIRVEGVLDARWAGWFGGPQVDSDGTHTVISGLLPDQPALHGVLAKIWDLGLCPISVQRSADTNRSQKAMTTESPLCMGSVMLAYRIGKMWLNDGG